MVKVMQFAVAQGKVAVHCHAGLGKLNNDWHFDSFDWYMYNTV